jgi:hypothetical protein
MPPRVIKSTELLEESSGKLPVKDGSAPVAEIRGTERGETLFSQSSAVADSFLGLTSYSGNAGAAQAPIVYGMGGNDQLIGQTNYSNLLDGGNGNDALYGGRMADYLAGGAGSDALHLGAVDGAASDGQQDVVYIDALAAALARGPEHDLVYDLGVGAEQDVIAMYLGDNPGQVSMEVIRNGDSFITNIFYTMPGGSPVLLAELIGVNGNNPNLSYTENGFAILTFGEPITNTTTPSDELPVESAGDLPDTDGTRDPADDDTPTTETPVAMDDDAPLENADAFGNDGRDQSGNIPEDSNPQDFDTTPAEETVGTLNPDAPTASGDSLPGSDVRDQSNNTGAEDINPWGFNPTPDAEIVASPDKDPVASAPDDIRFPATDDGRGPDRVPVDSTPHHVDPPVDQTTGSLDASQLLDSSEDISMGPDRDSGSSGVSIVAPEPVPLIAIQNGDGTVTVTHGYLNPSGEAALAPSDMLDGPNADIRLPEGVAMPEKGLSVMEQIMAKAEATGLRSVSFEMGHHALPDKPAADDAPDHHVL